MSIEVIAGEFGVRYILEGNVQVFDKRTGQVLIWWTQKTGQPFGLKYLTTLWKMYWIPTTKWRKMWANI